MELTVAVVTAAMSSQITQPVKPSRRWFSRIAAALGAFGAVVVNRATRTSGNAWFRALFDTTKPSLRPIVGRVH
jgi:hypothetical protein